MNKREKKNIEDIARKELLIETLDVQGLDDLDFHECSVIGIKAALTAAFEAGRKAAATPKQASLYDWEDINKAMMATGHSPSQIWRFLRALKDINKGA